MHQPGPASELVRATIAAEGPLRFDRYVELCLYAPGVGFFASGGGAGRGGRDFVTSPEVGPLLGSVLARYLDHEWDRLGRPDPFTVVEAGAGRGALARSVLAAEPTCREVLDLVLVERSASLRAEHPPEVTSVAELPTRLGTGVVVANELLDNVPFRVVERSTDGWVEVHVGLDGDGLLAEVLVPVADDDVGVAAVGPGRRVPVQGEAGAWVRAATQAIDRGTVTIVDYASSTQELAGRPWSDWLRTYVGHRRGTHPLSFSGGQDLTCDVCVDQLPTPTRLTTQAEFLREHGIDDLVDEGRRTWSERAHLGDLEALAARSRVGEGEALTDPDGLGGFVVMQWVVGDGDSRTIAP